MKDYAVDYYIGPTSPFHYFVLDFTDTGRRVQMGSAIVDWCIATFGDRKAGQWDAVVTRPTAVTFVLKNTEAAASFRLFWA